MADVAKTKTVEIADDQTAELARKAEGWERENKESKKKVAELTAEIKKLKSGEMETKERLREMELEIERNDEGKNVLESVANRAMELETEVTRLHGDLVAAVNEGEVANAEVAELKRALGEKGGRIDRLEKELEGLKAAKAESEKRVRELERKIGVLEVKETEEKSKKVRIEEEMRERLDEKESELSLFKKRVEDSKGLSLPVVAGSTGVVAVAAAAVYALYLRPR